MSKYIGSPVVSLVTDTVDVTGDITTTDATPEVIIVNDTHEDTDGGREGKVTFKGQQSGGEETTLAQIQASHDGTSDDEKGDLIFKTNDGSDGASPTERMRIDSAGQVTITRADNGTHLVLESTDADASVGPVLDLHRNSSSPADADTIGEIAFKGQNDADETLSYGFIKGFISDASDGTEDGQLNVNTMVAGTSRQRIKMDSTETVFNEEAQDIDFRVESANDTNMFELNAGNNTIGIGDTSPYSAAWGTTANTRQVGIKGSAYGVLHIKGDNTTASHFTMGVGDSIFYAAYDAIGGKHHVEYISNTETAFNNGSQDLNFRVEGNNNANGLVYDADDEALCVFTNSTATTNAIGITMKRNGRDSAFINIGHASAEGDGYSYMTFNYNSGQIGGITQSGTSGVNFNTSSDYRLKENVDYTFDATSRLKQLKPARFNFIAEPDRTIDGFLAHEVQSIVPQAVRGEKDEVDSNGNAVMQDIDHSKLVPLLVKTIQELEARITVLEAK